jgi:multicomponent Na+:H+ antiporter subunit D
MHQELILTPIFLPLLGAVIGLTISRWRRLQAWMALISMVISFLVSLAILYTVWIGGKAIVFQPGSWSAPSGISLVGDLLGIFMVTMAQLVISAGILYALGSKDQSVSYPAFFPLMLTLGAGLTGAFLAGDVFNLFVFAELLVVSGTVLTAISDNKQGVEAAYKYFYISIVASIFLLISIGSLYVSYGTLNMADLSQRVADDPQQPLLSVAIVFMLVFFMIKSAVVPFHFWQPDFHTTAPTPVSSLLSSVVVKLGVYGFLRMTTLLFVDQAGLIQILLVIFGMSGIVFGGLGAIGTHDAKRMLAYSTLAQVGFILVAIGWGTPLSIAAAIIYAFNHSLIKSAMLMLAGFMASRAQIKSAAFSSITGLGRSLPVAGVFFFIGGMALAGIPPTNGFISKLTLFQSGIQAREYVSLAILASASIFTLIYVGRAFQRIWWQAPQGELKVKSSGDGLAAPALLILASLGLGLWAEPLIQVALSIAQWLGDPTHYIQAVLGA